MIKDERPIVVGIGEALLDCFKNGTQELGGAPLIFAYHAAKSHCKGVIVSAIGVDDEGNIDDNGKIIINELIRHNLWGETKEFVFPVKNKLSGIVEVDDSDRNKPLYDITADAAWAYIPCSVKDKEGNDILIGLAEKTAAVYFGPLASYCGNLSKGTSKQSIDTFIGHVPKESWKIFDVNLRDNLDYGEELIREYIDKCNVLKANEEELDYVGRLFSVADGNPNKKGEELMKCCDNVQILILTKGEKGSTVFWRDKKEDENKNMVFSQSIHIAVEPENTVGAGDAMAGTFIGELLHGRSIPEAHYLAAQRSDLVCKEGKSMPDIPGKDFFFSHSRCDNVAVDIFYHKFTNNGYTVYKDNPELLPGINIGNDIADAITNCKVFVYFSSKTANESENVLDEINMAITNEKDIVIIMLDDSLYHNSVREYLEPIHHERFNMYRRLHNSKYDMFSELDDVSKKVFEFYNVRTK